MDFTNIRGHEKTIEILKKSIRNKTVSHSFLFEGEEGIGKKLVAYIFSKTLLCQEGQDEPCNQCDSCIRFDRGNHPDFFVIEPEKNLIRKAEIEGLVGQMTTAPYESKRKIFIINDSHTMNMESTNALLKTLEEPPDFVNIILISSSPNKLLTTILSRVHNIKFFPLKPGEVEKILRKNYQLSEKEARFIANFTRGAMGRSVELAEDEDFFKRREELISILDYLIRGDKTRAFSTIDFFNDNKDRIDEILDMMIYWFRDLMVYKSIEFNEILINIDKIDKLSEQIHIEFNKINDIIENIMDTKANIRRNVNFQLAIETMLLNI